MLQILALDIGTDLLPALALGAEPPDKDVLKGPARTGRLLDRQLLGRAFGVLGPVQAAVQLGAFVAVLTAGGWQWGQDAPVGLIAAASGTAFTVVVLGQLANAFACRSERRPVGRWSLSGNPLLLGAVASELVLLAVFLAVPQVADVLGHTVPTPLGWGLALLVVPALLLADAAAKAAGRRRRVPDVTA